MDYLDSSIEFYRNHAFAESTKRSYSTHLKTYLQFCQLVGIPPYPADTSLAARYIAYLAGKLQFSSLVKYINILRLLHVEQNLPNPLQHWFITSLLRGIKRVKGNMVHRKWPVTPNILLTIHGQLHWNYPKDVAMWAVYLTAFYTLMRKSSLLPPSASAFDPAKYICRGDVCICTNGLSVPMKHSKTSQFRERCPQLPLPGLPSNPSLCPLTAVLRLLVMCPSLPASAPLFSYPTPDGLVVLTQSMMESCLKTHVMGAGLPVANYGTHSLRRGGASWAFQSGMPAELIKILGGWESNCYQIYLDMTLDSKFQMMRHFTKYLPINS